MLCPSSIRRQDSNPRPSEHECPPITTRPGLKFFFSSIPLKKILLLSGGDVRGVFDRLVRGIKAVGDSVKAESGREFMLDPRLGFLHSCPTNLGTGMRASVHIDLPGWTKEGVSSLKKRCEGLNLQPRGTRGESGGQTGITYDISNKHRLGYSEVELVQTMIDGVNTLYNEDLELQKKHGLA